jgi:hypothetical protein
MPEIRGVVAQIPFTSANGILCHSFRRWFGLPCFPFAYATKWTTEWRLGVDLDSVSPEDVISEISPRPVFLIDEGRDELFPPNTVERLLVAAKEPKTYWAVPEAAHGQARRARPKEYERRVVAFWRKTLGIGESE